MIDRLSARTRELLREQPAAVASSRGVAAVTTANLAAYEHYFKARQALDLFRPEVAQRELAAALALDPDFALAHYQRAVVDAWSPVWLKFSKTGDEASGRTMQAHIDAAMRLADRLPEKERLGLLAWKATLDKRPDEAQRLRDQVAETFPQDKDAVFWAGDVRFHRGGYDEALPYFERALRLDPDFVLALDHEVRAHEQLGQSQAQLESARRWAALDPGAEPLRFQGRALLGLGRREEAERVFREVQAKEGGGPVPALGYWLIAQGRPHDAEALARDGLRGLAARGATAAPDVLHEDKGPPGVPAYRWLLATALGAQGRMREAREVVDGMVAAGATPEQAARVRLAFGNGARSPEQVHQAIAEQERLGLLKGAWALHGAALSLANVGDPDAAAAMEARAQAAPDWSDVPAPDREIYEALRAWRRGRPQEAEEVLRRLAERPQVGPRYLGLRLLGEVLLAQGRDAEGAEVLERSRALPWTMATDMRPWLEPGALLSLAEAYERLGDPARARARLDELLRAWQRADADLPRLADARAMRRRLPAQATQR
jgi:tetratricopeptide (TPR) repeat protein